jgi:succinate-semialdehyde dehydrogenase/glutarate-semialdehyde dehydrogenase
MDALKVGDPLLDSTDIGPLAIPQQVIDLEQQIQSATRAGARILTGGERMIGAGNFFEPTVLTGVPRNCPVYRDEIFGPVAMLFKVGSLDEAIELANDTPFGLGASVWTDSPAEQERLILALECGQVFVNTIVASDPRLPFGGIKRSGYGRELSAAGMREFLNAKTVVVANTVQQESIPFTPEPEFELEEDRVTLSSMPQTKPLGPMLVTSEEDEPILNRSPYDSGQFRQAFRTALEREEE